MASGHRQPSPGPGAPPSSPDSRAPRGWRAAPAPPPEHRWPADGPGPGRPPDRAGTVRPAPAPAAAAGRARASGAATAAPRWPPRPTAGAGHRRDRRCSPPERLAGRRSGRRHGGRGGPWPWFPSAPADGRRGRGVGWPPRTPSASPAPGSWPAAAVDHRREGRRATPGAPRRGWPRRRPRPAPARDPPLGSPPPAGPGPRRNRRGPGPPTPRRSPGGCPGGGHRDRGPPG